LKHNTPPHSRGPAAARRLIAETSFWFRRGGGCRPRRNSTSAATRSSAVSVGCRGQWRVFHVNWRAESRLSDRQRQRLFWQRTIKCELGRPASIGSTPSKITYSLAKVSHWRPIHSSNLQLSSARSPRCNSIRQPSARARQSGCPVMSLLYSICTPNPAYRWSMQDLLRSSSRVPLS
jgi:hypothetical protein